MKFDNLFFPKCCKDHDMENRLVRNSLKALGTDSMGRYVS